MPRAILCVLDSLGIGALPDAADYGDAGADTLGHIARHCAEGRADRGRAGPLRIPHLVAMGLGQAARIASGAAPAGCAEAAAADAAWAAARERSCGKDTTSGHWEMAGLPTTTPWGLFSTPQESFPAELLVSLQAEHGLPGWLGRGHASGTTILRELGDEHRRSGKPIVYTSADSVLQIAAHEGDFGLDRLYALCASARRRVDALRIGRVIARPFSGDGPETYRRTPNRRDYSMPPHGPTLLDALVEAGVPVTGVGKIHDIFAGRGVSDVVHAHGLDGLFDATLAAVDAAEQPSLVFSNFVDFDSEYGHRRDVAGYAAALEHFDARLPELLARLHGNDLLVLCADHGNDPTWLGSDHTREHIPVLLRGGGLRPGSHGLRDSFADIGQTLARHFGLAPLACGTAFDLLA